MTKQGRGPRGEVPAAALAALLAAILAATAAAWAPGLAAADPEALLAQYRAAGAGPFDAAAGAAAWTREHRPPGADGPRSCATCHGRDLTRPGKHVETGKGIEPLALSVNPKRLADPVKAERWFRRNCRWTLGRECTPQEKGDFAVLMRSR